MRNTEAAAVAALLAGLAASGTARAQAVAQGFAVERLVPAAPGGTGIALDDLATPAGFGGAAGLSFGYAHAPLRIEGAGRTLPVVEHMATASLALAASYDRFRLHAVFTSPVYVAGESGSIGGVAFAGPRANLESSPDAIGDVQLGLDARLWGDAGSALRLGAGAQLFVPSGDRAQYQSDGDYRAALRLLAAGDSGRFSWAGHLGAHLRGRDDGAVPGSPRGSELLFALGGAARLDAPFGALRVGPELTGATALDGLFGGSTTALEALASAALELPAPVAGRARIKLGLGAGLLPRSGAPQWRAVIAVELSGRAPPEQGAPSR